MHLIRLILIALGLIATPPLVAWAQPDPAAEDDGDVDDGDVDDEGGEAPADAKASDPPAEEAPERAKKASKTKTPKKKAAKKKKATKKKKKADEKGADEKDADEKKADEKGEPADDADGEGAGEAAQQPAAAAAEKTIMSETPIGDRVPVRQRAASSSGAIGLDRVLSADTGPVGTFRLKLGLRTFEADDFPVAGTTNRFTGTSFALAYTPIEALETWLRVNSTSNDNPDGRPSLLQTQGDIDLGAKVGWFVTDTIGLAFAANLRMISGLGSSGFDFDGLSYQLRALFTADLTRNDTAPVRVLLDISFVGENSEAVFAGQAQEPTPIQEWGLQAYRYDRLFVGLGLEFPASPYISPLLEYRIGTPFLVELSRRGQGTDEFEFNTVPHTIAGGVRAFPLEALAVDLIYRQGLSDNVFTGVEATPPWELVFGLSYTLDPRPKIIEREVAPAKPPAPLAPTLVGVKGRVLDAKTKKPIAGAIVTWRDPDLSPQVTDSKGIFEGYRFKPGQARFKIAAEGYLTTKTKRLRLKKKDRKITIKLKPDPKFQEGDLLVKATGPKGKPMGATITLNDPKNTTGTAAPEAPFKATLKAGRYLITAETRGFKTIKRPVDLVGGKPNAVSIPMQRGKGVVMLGVDGLPATAPAPLGGGAVPKGRYTPPPLPRAPRARSGGGGGGGGAASVKGRSIRVRGKIEFDGESARLTSGSQRLLRSVAALMKRDPKIKSVRIGAHTDGRGDPAAKRTLSIRRAQAVKSYLVSRGVARGRLVSKGYGPDKPIAPNMSARGRATNNRVELTILEMGK